MYHEFRETINAVISKYSSKTAFSYIRNDDSVDKVSFEEIGKFIENAGAEFVKIGLIRGDRVAIVTPHSPYAVFIGMALAYHGITIALIDASLPQKEIEKLIEFSDIKALFTTRKIYGQLEEEAVKKQPCFELEQGLKIVPFCAENTNCALVETTVEPDFDTIAILYSSGTTGEMKGSMVTYESVLKARTVFVRLAGLKDYMTYLLVLPFNHVAGFTGAMTFYLTGCEIGFIEDVDASKLQKGLLTFQPHFFAMVPKVYEVMEQKIRAAIREKGAAAERLMNTMFRVSKFFRKNFGINIGKKLFKNITSQVFGENIFGVGTGASPCKAETTEFFLNLGLKWANLYATTETDVPIVSTGIFDRYPVDTVGNVHRHPEIKIQIRNADNDGIGEITVKTELIMKGYFRRPDLTEEAFEDGYFKTGDYGYIDKKGYLHITGRIKESIVLQSGKKVSPSDVDDYYLEKIADYDIASRGIVNEKEQYDEIHLFVADKGFTVDEKKEIIKRFESESIAAPAMYKLSQVHFISSIPRTSVGKVKRFCLSVQEGEYTEKKETASVVEQQTVLDTIRFLISKVLGKALVIDENTMLIDDLGMDSLRIFELCVALDEIYDISLEEKIEKDISVGTIIYLIENRDQTKSDARKSSKQYPMERGEKDYRQFERFIKISKKLWKISVTGTEQLDENENYIFCPNHESYFDGMWIIGSLNMCHKKNICSVAAEYLFQKRMSQKGLRWLGGIPVDRSGNVTTALKTARQYIMEKKYSLLIHPEGTRSRTGELGEFKNGAAKLAIETGVKIIPVCINGAYEIFPPSAKLPKVFNWRKMSLYPLQISFGPAIDPEGKTEEEITKKIRDYIVEQKKADI